MLDVGQGPLERLKDCSGMMEKTRICFLLQPTVHISDIYFIDFNLHGLLKSVHMT